MKTKLAIVFVLLIVQTITAQNYQTVEDINDACAQLGFAGDEDAEIAVDEILDKIGLFRNFTIQECPDINNAVAKNIDAGSGRKERYILYDSNFFKRIDTKAGNDWAATSVLAHEIGHHLNGHALNNEGSNHKWELEADEFSGFVLARMGANLQDAQSAIQTLRYEKATSTHPAKADRLIAIETGWNRGNGKTIVVKKIDEEVIKKITENKLEEIKDGEVTAQQIFSNYIDAIGGQENINKIKTMSRKTKITSNSVINGKDYNSVSEMTFDYLTPNNYISKMTSSDFEMLKLDNTFYTKDKETGKWKFNNYNDMVKNQASYIWEYSLLVNNSEVTYLGIKNIQGVSCHAIKFPKKTTNTEEDTFKITMSFSNTLYYNVNTGLLEFMKTKSHNITDYKNNTEYLKDSDTHTEAFTTFTDYRPVNGVLFSFKSERTSNSETMNQSAITEYTDIQVNPYVNKEDFKVIE